MSMFISLEGLHGVGKSTIAEKLASTLNVELTPTIPDEFREIRKTMNESWSIEARYMMFMSAVLLAGERIRESLALGKTVVVESYIYRTIAFHEGMGSQIRLEFSQSLLLPHHTILLKCDNDVRQERLVRRGGARNRWDSLAEANSDTILARYQRFGFPTIDTTHASPEETLATILEVINGK